MRRKLLIVAAVLLALLAVGEMRLGLPTTPEGALRHTLLLRGDWRAAFCAVCTDVSGQAAQYLGLTEYELAEGESLYLLSGQVPRSEISGIALDTWTVEKAGPFYHCEFSGKG